VNCVFIGLHPDHIGYFYEVYGIHPPNHFFNPKFKLGSWDGKIRYFHKTGKTFVNLLPDIIPKVIGLGYNIRVDDLRKSASVTIDPIEADFFAKRGVLDDNDEPWKMRDYQLDMVNALTKNGGGVGIAGTGGGKTSMCAAIALLYEEAAGFRSIIIVPDKNLTDQTRTEYEYFTLDVGEYSGDNKDLNHQHIVSTWQALKNNPKIIQSFDVVIVDEAQGLRGAVLTKLMNEYGCDIPYRFGVTGTLPKDATDAMSVKIAVGIEQYHIPAHILIEQGHLAKLNIDIMEMNVDLKSQYDDYVKEFDEHPQNHLDEKKMTYRKFKDSYFPDWPAEKSYLQSNAARLDWIVQYIDIKRHVGKGNTLCLVNGVNVGKKLAKMVPDSVFLHGTDKMKVRKEIYETFKTNDNLVVFATVNIASTGLNIKRIFNLMFIDVGRSFIRTIQTIGRGLRTAHDKDAVHVTDICADLKYSRKHVRERIKYYKEAKYPHKKISVDF
jgi:superfamily II DNA or RNA helicase